MSFRLCVLSLAFISALGITPPSRAADANLTRQDVEGIVKDMIMEHPEWILQSVEKMQERAQKESVEKAKAKIAESKEKLLRDPMDPVAGNPKGDITVVEFFDYHCGYCKRAQPTVAKLLEEDKKIRVVFKEFPILSPDSEMAAKAALAFYKLNKDKYFEYHSALMKVNGKYDMKVLSDAAKDYGVKESALQEAMGDEKIAQHLRDIREMAQSIGIQGTPAFIVEGELIPGAISYEDLKKKIQEVREGKKG